MFADFFKRKNNRSQLLLTLSMALLPALLAAENDGKVSGSVLTPDVSGLKVKIRNEFAGGDWGLRNEGDLILVFTNAKVSPEDRKLYTPATLDGRTAPYYRIRVLLEPHGETTGITMNKELAYTSDQGEARVKLLDDSASVDQLNDILRLISQGAAAPAPAPTSDEGVVSSTLHTTNLSRLKKNIKRVVRGDDWDLRNAGDNILLFTKTRVTRRDMELYTPKPLTRHNDPSYRLRVKLLPKDDSITVSMTEELIYTSDKGESRVKTLTDDATVSDEKIMLLKIERETALSAR